MEFLNISVSPTKLKKSKWPIFRIAYSLHSYQLYPSALLLKLRSCLLFVAIAVTTFEIEAIVYCTVAKISDQSFMIMKIRLP